MFSIISKSTKRLRGVVSRRPGRETPKIQGRADTKRPAQVFIGKIIVYLYRGFPKGDDDIGESRNLI